MGRVKAQGITTDVDGNVFIVTDTGRVMKWEEERKWADMGLSKALEITAGPSGQLYATAKPKKQRNWTIYKY